MMVPKVESRFAQSPVGLLHFIHGAPWVVVVEESDSVSSPELQYTISISEGRSHEPARGLNDRYLGISAILNQDKSEIKV